jgi:outer membrane protein insertion porin family
MIRRMIIIVIWTFVIVCAAFVPARSDTEERPAVKSIVITGNDVFNSDRLKGVMVTRSSGFFQTRRFYQSVFDDDLKNLVAFYNQNGYLGAAITDTSVNIDTVANSVDIAIEIREGEVTRIDGMAVFNNTVFSDSALLSKVGLHAGDPFRRSAVENGMLAMLNMYAEDGYLDAAVTPDIKINDETHLAMVDFTVAERSQSHIDSIVVTGLINTHPYVVTRELLFKSGEIVHYSALLKSQRRLYETGLFESVFIRPVAGTTGDSTGRNILVDLKEKLNSEFNVAVGYGSVDKIRGSIELLTRNLAGTGRQLGSTVSGSFIRRAVEASFTEPRTFGSRWRTDVNLMYEFLNEPGYNLSSIGGRLTVGRAIRDHATAQVTLRVEHDALSRVKVQEPVKDFHPDIRSLTFAFVNDTRDNLFNPTRGMYIGERNELAGAFLKGSNTFARTVVDWKYFYPWTRHTILAFAFEFGWMDYFGGSKEIPLNERFYAGGPNSVRGFGYQLLGPLDTDGDPIGGKLEIIWHVVELRQTIYRMFGGGVFVDAGNVWPSITDFAFTDIRPTAGGGLRANTPLGILRLDLGVNLDKLPGESRMKVYFSMGQAF